MMLACTICASLVRKKSLRRRMQHEQYLGSTQELLSGGFRPLRALLSIPDRFFFACVLAAANRAHLLEYFEGQLSFLLADDWRLYSIPS
jgi:hypothetical protein